MDTRTTSADFYPGGKTPVTAGGGITSGETGGAAGEPMVPVTKVEQLPEHYRESDMRSKINELARVISGGVAAIMAMVSLTLGAEPVKVLGAKKDALWNDDFVVTNVVTDLAGFATTNTVTGATNALAATFVRGLEVATNAVLQAGAKEIAAATNALSQSVDERLKASTNGSFSASLLEPYAKRTWVEAQGYLKSTNLTGYAQVNWVQNQGFIKKENASGEIARIVNEKIAAQDKTAAYRLMTADGTEWIDGTGVWWKVTGEMEVDGLRLSGSPDAMNWDDDKRGCECRIEEQGEDGYLWSYIKTIRVVSDDGYEYETRHQYTVLADRKTGTMEAKIEESDNFEMANGSLPPETLTMRHWIATNTVTRLATTNDMPKIDFSKIPTLTTNDVCAIVTNTVPGGVGIGDNWRITSGAWDGFALQSVTWVEEPRALYGGFWSVRIVDGSGYSVGDSLTEDPPTAWRLKPFGGMVVERDREAVNALGLAMAKDLEGIVTSVSNTVVEIVTNEIMVGWTEWEVRQTAGYAGIVCSGVYATDGLSPDEPVHWMIDCKEWSELHGLQEQKYHVPGTGAETNLTFTYGLTATRRRVTQNALGLAKAKDTVSAEAVTNIARDVSNSFWDEKNSVLWRLDFRDGEPMFVPVTNENVKATGGVL